MGRKPTNVYQSPLGERYTSKEMQQIFSADEKFTTWRKLWIVLAKLERELGLNITDAQIRELEEKCNDINYDVAEEQEKKCRHDVMAHIHAYGQQCPTAKGIIHLGATSCFVTDNTDMIVMRKALLLVRKRLLGVIKLLSDFALDNKDIVTLGYTHYQPAQLTTVGKRATLWIQEFVNNYKEVENILQNLQLLGCKGTTGTQESFMKLFSGDENKVQRLDEGVAESFDFVRVFSVSGQTYPRSEDVKILDVLSHIAISCNKFGSDLRHLQHDKEMEEPFEKGQIGSSAMAYKRNPMRSERICSISRKVINCARDAIDTAMNQWIERTLDDSANKRMCVPDAFMALDAVLILCANVADGIVVNKGVIQRRVQAELPFMATEEIIMSCVNNGGDRQEIHEHIRVHSMAATKAIKEEGKDNDLVERIAGDPIFNMTVEDIENILEPSRLCGRAPNQVTEYFEKHVKIILVQNKSDIENIETKVNV